MWIRQKKTCKTTDGQHLLLTAYLLRRRLRFYGGSLEAPEGATTSYLRQPPQERSMRSARSLSPPQSCTGRKCHRIEYDHTYVWLSFCSTSIVVYAVPGRPWSCSNFERTHGRAITKIRQQRTRTDPHRGCRVECTSREH